MTTDYYQALGVDKNATKEDIRKAYKKLAMQYHPDRAPAEKKKEYEEKFKEISQAAAILNDDKKRQQYDQYGAGAFNGQAGNGFEGYDFSDFMSQFGSGMHGNFEDIFDHIFGGTQTKSHHSRRGRDLLYEITISLEEAASGITKEIELNKLEHCKKCHGKGALKFENCHHCQGSGYMKRTQRTAFGIFQQSMPCGYCKGLGELPQDSCNNCGGEGVVRIKKDLEVKIPAGIEESMRLRVRSEGEVGENEGANGDLYVEVHIKEHEYFTRESNDLYMTLPISFTQAVLGDEIEVPTITGKAKLKVPPGTASETILRMQGKGMPSVHSHDAGDQMVKVRIEVPKKLTKRQKELLLELGEEKASKSFLKKIFG